MATKVAGVEPGQRQLNGPQTTGRQYRNLSPALHGRTREDNVPVPVRDGTRLLADIHRPDADGRFPALISAAPYPRQLMDLGAPAAIIEAGASDFWVPRGYAHVIANLRGTVGSGGTYTFFDAQEREDLFDLIEWVAGQPWCDGNVGMIGISYYAMTQMEAATQRPPHLKALFPFNVTVQAWEASYHNGLLSDSFITPWFHAMGVLSAHGDRLYRKGLSRLLRKILAIPAVHHRFRHADVVKVHHGLEMVSRLRHDAHPWLALLNTVVEHPIPDAWWDERDLTELLAGVDIPVYLGGEWSNVALHLPGLFKAWEALARNPHVRMSMLGAHGLPWPWESMHIEALAWFDHWLKGLDTGILEGPAVRYWLPGAEQWCTADSWPPPATHLALSLSADGSLTTDERPGERSYATDGANAMPAQLSWTSDPLPGDLDMVGYPELRLTATSSGDDTGWILLLQDVGPDGTSTDVTQGWLRASMRHIDEDASEPGRPVLPMRTRDPIPAGEPVDYRIPLVANARRFSRGHRIRLILTSDDTRKDFHPMMLFSHTPVGIAGVNTVHSSSRLLLPILEGA
ncbi:CocE/NonD family hydrolase [Nocardia amamiensis]|uniref:CocE/NonD family hydrolase n=1 Tax=Nocardia amamiensis TaxID=404578 RepID=UPI000833C33F|nr:CocE/NonD family hydrolase [Nocardia amamiensis]